LLPRDLLSLNIFFLNSQDTTSSNLFVIINDLKKIFLNSCFTTKNRSQVMLPSMNINVLALKIIRKLYFTETLNSSISLLAFTFRKGISQLLECDDCASFMSKYSTRNASHIYIVEPSEVRSSHRDITGS
jgi:hypothetical protein